MINEAETDKNENLCSFLKPETVQNIEHLFCTNPQIKERNNIDDDTNPTCMGGICEFKDRQ